MTKHTDPQFRTSTRRTGGDCTEVAFTGTEVLLRDSKTTATIAVSRPAWRAFLTGLRSGAFDPDRLGSESGTSCV